MNTSTALMETVRTSEMYRNYERAFSTATGLPLALRPVEAWQPPLHGKKNENAFCAMMAGRSATCAACLRMQQRMSTAACNGPAILKCHFGLSEAAVPVKAGERTLGYLTTGQVLTQEPGSAQLESVARGLKKLGINGNTPAALAAYKQTRVMPRAQLGASVNLLETFAEHLSDQCNRLAVQQSNAEPIAVVRAKAYIRENLAENITLRDVARAACTSTFYICKLFKRHTGVNFTEYVSRMRTERSKELLANPNLRVSEIAFEVGFQSLTHFNRVFREIVGEAPTAYRQKLAIALAA